MTNDELVSTCMEMISNTGTGRTMVYEAIDLFVNDKFDECIQKLNEAETYIGKAHKLQFEKIMSKQSSGEEIPFNMLLLHAMDITLVTNAEHDMLLALAIAKKNKK